MNNEPEVIKPPRELKTCPFCGEKPVLEVVKPHKHHFGNFFHESEGGYFLSCACGIALTGNGFDELEAVWNRRKMPDKTAEFREAAKTACALARIKYGNLDKDVDVELTRIETLCR